jgi:hypothetical protein
VRSKTAFERQPGSSGNGPGLTLLDRGSVCEVNYDGGHVSEEDPRLKALAVTCQSILSAAAQDPAVAERALRRLSADPVLAVLVEMPPGLKRTGRRAPASLDPFKVLADSDEEALALQLAELDLEHLRDIVAQFGMDPRRLAMKWKEPQRVREHIVETTVHRSRKGDAFRG